MTSYKPQVGDIVSASGRVIRVYSDGAVDLDNGGYIGFNSALTLVKPEPKVSIELTESTINKICVALAETHSGPDSAWNLADDLRVEFYRNLDERS